MQGRSRGGDQPKVNYPIPIVLENGTLIVDETYSPDCLRGCNPDVFTGVLTDVIVGGTGAYAGASGTLSGTVRATVGVAIHIKLSGTLALR